ncbi:Rieske (2Fe-2S) protein [Yinghuangia soli]|uniref:Cytochrome bc1 complex Rieske iron-sulfur subunit n=1 Tax=Yinghuangia soli TaxID=2908204 RepID=A0AA41PZ63_9ACTN|nr:Rieske (2Fe-2S) protein [Yinghuangia soli]MCF2528277.1 Rieske (2Fe-2S) protein [Yinghuangia soli]
MDTDITGVGRRRVLAVSAAAVGGAALVACGSDDKETPPAGTPDATGGGSSQPSGSGSTSGSTGAGSGAPAGKALAKTTDIPVGGGKIIEAEKVVVTQPTAGTFKAFSATCTHQGCTVATVSNGTINCACHGSKFSAADGSVKNGPATKPLAEKQITTSGDQISLA